MITTINNEYEHEEALDIVDKLMDKKDKSDSEMEALDRLVDLIVEYEDIHYPMWRED